MKYRKKRGPALAEHHIADATRDWTPGDYAHFGKRALLLAVLNHKCGCRKIPKQSW